MTLRAFVGLAVVLLASRAYADGHPVPMWEIEGDTNRVYLLGSIHLLRAEDHPLPAVFDKAYDEAESLIMELDMDDIDPAELQAMTNEYGVISDDKTLRDLMGETHYTIALTAAKALDIPFDMLDKTEPWLAAITVEQLILKRMGFNPRYGIEAQLLIKAVEDNKPILGLETVAEQLGFLDALSLQAQTDLLLKTLQDGIEAGPAMDLLIAAWRRGDTGYLENEMLADIRADPELYRSIVADRNHRWLGRIEDLLDDQDDYLIVVGALHLVGDDGIPSLLEERGIHIRQMYESF